MSKFLEHDWFPQPLPENVKIGERSWLYSTYAFRHFSSRRREGLRVGHDTGLYHTTFFDVGPGGEVTIGNFSTLVGAIISTNRRVVIGNYVFIAHEVVIADEETAIPPFRESISSRLTSTVETQGTSVFIGDGVWIGMRAVLLKGASIGEGSIIGAATVINFAVPPLSVVAGNPARIIRRLSSGS